MVNGNVGAGVAVAGAFSLVRFRSVPGSAKEICAIFLAMGAGLVTGMGFIGYAVLFATILGGAMFICSLTGFGGGRDEERALKITVPENLDYTEAFDERQLQTDKCEDDQHGKPVQAYICGEA